MVKDIISFEDFGKLDIRIGKVKKVEKKEGADKLLRLTVDFGPEVGTRNILSGIAPWYKLQSLKNKKFPFLVNLAPRKMMGEESQGMILCVDDSERAILVPIKSTVKEGSVIR